MVAPEQQQPGRPGGAPGFRGVRIGRPFGVPIYVSPSWLLFLALITVQFAPVVARAVPGIGGAKFLVASAFGVFLGMSVLAHEVAHCVVARRFKIPIERISLSFMAGHSALAHEPETAGRSSAVAAAGPAANLLIALCSWLAFRAVPSGSVGSVLTAGLTWTNGLVGIYNLLPGLPLDGGQLLRAGIWRVTGNARTGTIGAGWAGRIIALLTAALACALLASRVDAGLSALWGFAIAAMLWTSSGLVLHQQALRDRLPEISARTLSRAAIPVTLDVPLAEAVRRAQEANARGIVIVDADGRPTGVVEESEVNAVPVPRRPWINVGAVSHQVSAAELLDADLVGEELLKRLQLRPASEYVVVDSTGGIHGVLAAADVAAALNGKPLTGQEGPRPQR